MLAIVCSEMALLTLVSLSTSDCLEHEDVDLSRYKFCSNEDSSDIMYPFMSGGFPAP